MGKGPWPRAPYRQGVRAASRGGRRSNQTLKSDRDPPGRAGGEDAVLE